ncbi:POU domain, class 6, transcription factor 2 [Coccinella septempunctata]|uniref:POU domain, class 6, transcription factor 2 n=1 Tax=Coccinella septempunctata TaxID=41139 RepID=UPI001D064506|nr:POU domain, class 6, transcription factor 2 [Coccinella septempunctata]
MAEGSVEDDNSEMLGPTAPSIQQTHIPPNSNDTKDEESDCDSIVSSPEPAYTMGVDMGSNGTKSYSSRMKEEDSTNEPQVPPPNSQINGAMAGLITLQNLASMQQNSPLGPTMQNISSIGTNNSANTPLNLSVSASAATPRSNQTSNSKIDNVPSMLPNPLTSHPGAANGLQATPNPMLAAQQPVLMPQMILASGQLVPGIQGAQLLIPTSQGLVTQTILTIPVNHVNSADQMVNLALSNGQVVSTTLANLQAMAHTNLLNNTAAAAAAVNPVTNGAIGANILAGTGLSHILNNGSSQNILQNLPKLLTTHSPTQPLLNAMNAAPIITSQAQMSMHSTSSSPHNTPPHRNHMAPTNHYGETKHHASSLPQSCTPPNIPSIPSMNGELTITPTHVPNSSQSFKRSPPRSESPGGNDTSSNDLMIDSPNQPTISQANSNVIDGINLDEIKDFAKAFKLRRLSLGLTQTQVGQALSVTEGPAYSQSAICSALASQMFAAAQLTSQQQAMFEKLDITPKSAQKIKPVLERWMKEAEDRYKSGQNHLTDFIGIEPSKKRKRRTSFTPQALELLNAHFERNTHPSGTEITGLAHQLGYEREVIRIWFCNKRQALKNTVRMMSKSVV